MSSAIDISGVDTVVDGPEGQPASLGFPVTFPSLGETPN